MKLDREQDAAVLIVLGQSNAHGHGTRLQPKQRIIEPLRHVHGLARAENQAYDLADVAWSGFTSYGMNLGETQDHTCCLANYFAIKWQQHIDAGNSLQLPDLYIIQISIGGQGIAAYEGYGNMWHMKRQPVLKPGNLFDVDISLYPLTVQILDKAMCNLQRSGKTPRVIGLHWNQWETEVDTGGSAILDARENYTSLFTGLREAIGSPFVIYLYQPLSDVFDDMRGLDVIERVFADFAAFDQFNIMDLRQSQLYNGELDDKGIFQKDGIHYHCRAQQWFSDHFFTQLFGNTSL